MSLEIEVRSSGPGPRSWLAFKTRLSPLPILLRATHTMAKRWTRLEVNHRGHMKWLSDGVAIVIRKRED